jgi:hypothetical protein
MHGHMADWRQIQARIRKAKASSDASAQLAELYERTRDAMVAFELAHCYEKAEDNIGAVRWYTCAAERFRRAQWRTKAEEALTRLGAPIPVYATELAPEPKRGESKPAIRAQKEAREGHPAAPGESESVEEQHEPAALESAGSEDETGQPANSAPSADGAVAGEGAGKKRRRRGRRGGRKRRGSASSVQPGLPGGHAPGHATGQPSGQAANAASGAAMSQTGPRGTASRRPGFSGNAGFAGATASARSSADDPRESEPRGREYGTPSLRQAPDHANDRAEQAHPASPSGRELWGGPEGVSDRGFDRGFESAAAPSWQGRTRAGEPALASRISQLESQLRRLLACPLASLDDADQAPAGPGVLLLSDSDQVTHYYIEACQTLRIGIGNLLRGGRGSKDSGLLKERMAENLGIAEARVARYLKEHCAVRWLQLDDGAPHLAHFAIAVLRPVVND